MISEVFPSVAVYLALVLALIVVGLSVFLRWGARWGSTPEERALELPGDALLENGPPARLVMTRAVSIRARPESVWPWLAQMGRGAGWYSIDRLDNGGKTSARHIVSWIPEPRVGDATPIGYLRQIDAGRGMIWWLRGLRFAGATTRLVVDMRVTRQDEGARLVNRVSADATGRTAHVALLVFQFLDSVMSRRQLLGIRQRVERYGVRPVDTGSPETGSLDQYQLYEVIYASGERAGVPGKEHAADWRRAAFEDGVLDGSTPPGPGAV